MKLKSHEEFVNETLVYNYSYYGQGSLLPIVHKLATEGKTSNQIYVYLTTLGIDEERKRKVISQVFVNESIDFDAILEAIHEGLFEKDDEIDDLVKADTDDLAKGVDPSKAKSDPDIEDALDKLKSGDEEDEEDKKEDGDSKDSEEETSDKVDALRAALKDAEKLDRIKKILLESYENELKEK